MQCKDFNNRLAALGDINRPTTLMQQHMEHCPSCRETYAKAQMLFDLVAEEKLENVSPFINTRIMAQIEKQEERSWIARPAFVPVMSAALLFLGFISASIFTNPNQQVASNSTEIIASEYYFSDNPGTQLENIWLNSYQYE
jgi:hypothetical protein